MVSQSKCPRDAETSGGVAPEVEAPRPNGTLRCPDRHVLSLPLGGSPPYNRRQGLLPQPGGRRLLVADDSDLHEELEQAPVLALGIHEVIANLVDYDSGEVDRTAGRRAGFVGAAPFD